MGMSMLPLGFLLAATGAPAASSPWPPNAVVLVVAGWCAPCHGEVQRLDAIADAAGGRQVRVVGLDLTAGTRALLARVSRARRWDPSPAERGALRDAVYARSAGLPYAVATDAAGQACADLTRGLDAARTRELVARCDRRPSSPTG